jgi:non-heme chloroperoxidase
MAGTAIRSSGPITANAAVTGGYVRIGDDVELYYEEAGRGAPLIFIPGWTYTTEVFVHQLSHFADRYRVITLDPRGHGRSSLTLENNNYTQHGADLAAFIDRLGLKDVILAGWSFGCLDAYAYVRKEGIGNLKAFIGIDELPKSLATAENDDGAEGGIAVWKDFICGTTYARREFAREFAKWMVKRELSPCELDWLVAQSLKTPTSVAVLLLTDAMFADYTPEATRMDGRVPVLNVVREERAARVQAWMRTSLPHSESLVFEGQCTFGQSRSPSMLHSRTSCAGSGSHAGGIVSFMPASSALGSVPMASLFAS